MKDIILGQHNASHRNVNKHRCSSLTQWNQRCM